MKLAEALEAYYVFSGKASDASRQLALGGIAIVWIFKLDSNGAQRVHPSLMLPSLLLILCLTCDLLQYTLASILWSAFHRSREKIEAKKVTSGKVPTETEIGLAPEYLNWLPLALFYSKIGLVITAYLFLFIFIAKQ